MTNTTISGIETHLKPAERMVPNINWYTWLNKIAELCINKMGKVCAKNGYKYVDLDFWRVIVYKCMNYLNTKDAADELDDLIYEQKQKGKGWKKKGRRQLGGNYPRFERMVPNESQVNAYIRRLPKYLKNTLIDYVFQAQIELAMELGILGTLVEGYIDYTDKYFYGNDTNATNPDIIGVYNGLGTDKARKYLGIMVSSGKTKLFVQVIPIKKGQDRAKTIVDGLKKVMSWGLKFKRVDGDREFSTYDLIALLKQEGIPYLGTIKKTKPIKRLAEDLLDGRSSQVVSHQLNQHQFTKYKLGPQSVTIIMKTDPGRRIRDVRKDLNNNTITRKEALKSIHVFVTTEIPPKSKRSRLRWGLRLTQIFRKRWRIETGYADINRIFPTSHARSNETKLFMTGLRMFTYNAWQIQRALHYQLCNVPKSWKRGPTFRRFSYITTRLYVCA